MLINSHVPSVIVFFLMCTVPFYGLSCKKLDNEDKTRLILFQKLNYSKPTNSFFLVKFNTANGEGEKICDFNISEVSIETKKSLLHNVAEKNAFLLNLYAHDTKYRIFYTIGEYHTYVLSPSGKIIEKIQARASSYVRGNILFYRELSDFIALDLVTGKKTYLLKNVRFLSIAPTRHSTFLFKKGKIIDFEKKSKVSEYHGLVTESGYLAENWIWFSQRKHEKTNEGEIWAMNILTGKTFLVRRWWESKWKHSVALMELESKANTLVCEGR